MVKATGLSYAKLVLTYSESKNLITIKTTHPRSNVLLGYILFKHDRKKLGTLELTNFGAAISRQNFTMGGTTKDSETNQAGQHGEGLKLASLRFAKENYQVRLQSSEVNCYFKFDNLSELGCNVVVISRKKIEEAQKKISNPRGMLADPVTDVSVIVGEPGKKLWSKDGKSVKSKKIPLQKFRQWLKMHLYPNPPRMVNTPRGDLILDPEYAGAVYVKNLKLKGILKSQRYGYNFRDGETGRDRSILLMPVREKAQSINAIWAHAISPKQDHAQRLELTELYTNLLIKNFNRYDDVNMFGYRDWPNNQWIGDVWSHLRKNPKIFYYEDTAGGQEASEIIENNLKREPKSLPTSFWELLKWGLKRLGTTLNTPQEEQKALFENAPIITGFHTEHAQILEWMLKCCTLAYEGAESKKYIFVDGKNFDIDAVYGGDGWKINNKWLNNRDAHLGRYCIASTDDFSPDDSSTDDYFCYHLVEDLWTTMASQLQLHSAEKSVFLDGKVKTLLMNTPRKGMRPQLLRGTTADMSCDCPSQRVRMSDHYATFTDLDPALDYIPSVSGNYKDAFVAFPPPPSKPRALRVPRKKIVGTPKKAATASFVLGDKVDNSGMGWQSNLPCACSYELYHAGGEANKNVLIGLPPEHESRKRKRT
ncbi:unnamed protein product [Periconia digitata]|uniref:Uncharacterized protein n=1 Tax=Periconia digitata TaxID=1303443 RepID=A0A9W4U391_9PLEO|nr:unnamed protein product [Periconia digitata]